MKKLPASLRTIVCYTWLASLGLHAIALVIPLPSSDSSSEQPPEQNPVKVVKLPKPSPTTRQSPQAVSTPVPKKSPLPRKPAAASPASVQTSVAATPRATPSTRPPAASPSPDPTSSPSVTPSVTPTPDPPDALATVLNRGDAKPGCKNLGDCWQVEESQWRSFAGDLKQQLEQQGYQVEPVDQGDDTGMQVYKVSKNGVQKYLHLISRDQRTVYLLQPELLNRDELEQAIDTGVS